MDKTSTGKALSSEDKFMDYSLISFTFSDFLQALSFVRDQFIDDKKIVQEMIPSSVKNMAKLLDKDCNEKWMLSHPTRLFSWKDFCTCHRALEETKLTQDVREFLTSLCFFYYQVNGLHEVEESFESFMSHRPYDYTRPHLWYKEQDYVSIGEMLLVLEKYERKEITKSEKDEVFRGFRNTFNCFEQLETSKELTIPYTLYSTEWENLHDPLKIRPWSIEVCVYYVMQKQIPITYIFEEKRSQDEQPYCIDFHDRYFLPPLKWCDLFDLQRILYSCYLYKKSCLGHKLPKVDFGTLFSNNAHHSIFTWNRNTGIPTYAFSGIRKKETSSYRESMEEYFAFFGLGINVLAFGYTITALLKRMWKATEAQKDSPITNALKLLILPVIATAIRELRKIETFIIKWQSFEELPTFPWEDTVNDRYKKAFPMFIWYRSTIFPFDESLNYLIDYYLPETKHFDLKPPFQPTLDTDLDIGIERFTSSAAVMMLHTGDPSYYTLATSALSETEGSLSQSIWKDVPKDLVSQYKLFISPLSISEKEAISKYSDVRKIAEKITTQDSVIQTIKDVSFTKPSLFLDNI